MMKTTTLAMLARKKRRENQRITALDPRGAVVEHHPVRPKKKGDDNHGSSKRHKSTGEKMTEAILELAVAHKTLADTSASRQEGDRMCKLSRSDIAIKEFKDHLASTIEVAARFRLIQLLATNPNAATMYCSMDDECRFFFVQEFLAGNTDFQ